MPREKIGRYQIERAIGRGAMGEVYLAFDPVLERQAAIKVMTTSGEVDEELRTRFFREARSAARLKHPNIIGVYDMGEDRKRPFIAMEFVDGEDLRTLIEKKAFIPFERKLDLVIQICRALHYAHRNGVIHRDVKPGNISITHEGEVKILDFGLARLDSSEITRTGMMMGTPYYMSPEQVRGSRDLDGRSDLFSVAVVLYELITNSKPFEADTPTGVIFKIVSDPHTPVKQFFPGCSDELIQIIDRALAKDREARFANCEEMAEALKSFQHLLPRKLQDVRRQMDGLQAQLKKLRNDNAGLITLDLLDASSFQLEEAVADPMATLLTQDLSLAPENDYGCLLLRHARLQQRLELIARQVVEVRPLLELFDRSRHQIEKNEIEACLATLGEIFHVQPKNAAALEMQKECQHLLEERRRAQERRLRLNSALSLAREALDRGNPAQCLQAASRALQIEPGNVQALELQRLAMEALERRRRMEELLATARAQAQAGEYEASYRAATEGLNLEGGNEDLRKLQAEAQRALAKRQKVQELVEQTREQRGRAENEAVLQTVEELLSLEPGHKEALELGRQARQILERERKLEELLAAARAHAQAGEYEASYRVATEGLSLEAGNEELRNLQVEARQALANRQKVQELVEQAREERGREEYEAVLQTVEALLRVEPGLEEALELGRQSGEALERKRKVEELLAAARAHAQALDYETGYRVATEGLSLEPRNEEFKKLQAAAQQALAQRQTVLELVERARQQRGREENAGVLQTVEELLSVEPGHKEALELGRQAQEALERKRKVEELLAAARAHAQAGDYEAGYRVATEGLNLEPGNEEFKKLRLQAQRALEKVRRVQELMEEARRQWQGQDYPAVLQTVEELLKVEPEHDQALELKRQAAESLERGRKVEELLAAARAHAQAQAWEACYRVSTEGLELDPGHAELGKLQASAHRVLEKRHKVKELLEKARDQRQRQDHQAVLQTAEELLGLEPKHAEALELKRQATESLERGRKVEELLAAARAHAQAQAWEACYRVSTEGLELDAGNADLGKLQATAHSVLEKRRKVKELSEKARDQRQKQDHQAVLQTAEQLLALEPGQVEALEMKRLSSEALKRRLKLHELLAAARAYEQEQDYEASYRVSTEGLGLDSANQELKQLQERAHLALAKIRKVQELLQRAIQERQRKDHQAVLRTVEELLAVEPQHAEASAMKRQAAEALERDRKVEELLAVARAHAQAQEYEACVRVASEGLGLDPANPEFKRLQEQVQGRLAKKRKVQELVERARQQWGREEYAGLLQAVEELLRIEPGHGEALELKRQAGEALARAQKVKELVAAAWAHAQAQEYEACVRVTSEGLGLDPENRDFKRLGEQARQALEKIRNVQDLLQRAIQQRQRKEHETVLRTVEELLAVEPQHVEALDLKRQARETLERGRKVEELLAAARAHAQTQEYEACVRVTTEGLTLEPGNEELRRLQAEAQETLAKKRKVQELAERARQQGQRQDHRGVVRAVEELLTLEPGHAEALELKQRAGEALAKEQKVRELLASGRAHAQAQEYEACVTVASEGLGLDPENRDFKILRDQAQQALEKIGKVRDLLQRAIQQRQRKDHQAVLRTAEELLAVEPEHAEALELKQQAGEALAREQNVKEFLAAGRAHLQAKEYEACVRVITEGLILEPGNEALRKLKAEAQQALEKIRRVQELAERARQQWGREEYAGVLQAVEELLGLEPSHDEALKLKRQAGEALAKKRKVQELLQRVIQERQRKDHQAVLRTAKELLAVEPRHAEALELKQQAEDALARERKVKELLAAARVHAQSQEYEACYQVSTEGLGLDPGNEEFGKLQASANQVLEKRRLQEKRRALLDRLWTSARNDMEKRRFKPAYRTLGQLLELEPGNNEALALRQQAEAALAVQRQKVRRMLPIAAGLLLAVAFGAGGLWTLRDKKGPSPSSPSAEGKLQAPASTIVVPAAPVATPPPQDIRITRGLEMASNFLESKKYSEAALEAKRVLELSPGNPEAESLLKHAQENLDRIAALRQARALKEAGKFEEAIASLGTVLKLAPSDFEARKLLKELDRYARKGADEALEQSKQARSASEAAKAPDLVRNLFDRAQGIDSEAMTLYRGKQFGQATARFSEAREAYQRATTEAKARTQATQQQERQQADQRDQAQKVERDRQLLAQQQAAQRDKAQSSRHAYDRARDRATQASAETKALERFQQATALAAQAQAKMDRGDLQGAQHDFETATNAMELAATTAETVARQTQVEETNRAKDAAQKETDRRGVEEVLKSYKAAWERKDLEQLRTLWPGLGGGKEKKIKQTFEFSRSIKVDLQLTNINMAGDAATVTCQRQDQTVTINGDKFSSKPFKTTITLRRAGGTWVIEDVR